MPNLHLCEFVVAEHLGSGESYRGFTSQSSGFWGLAGSYLHSLDVLGNSSSEVLALFLFITPLAEEAGPPAGAPAPPCLVVALVMGATAEGGAVSQRLCCLISRVHLSTAVLSFTNP